MREREREREILRYKEEEISKNIYFFQNEDVSLPRIFFSFLFFFFLPLLFYFMILSYSFCPTRKSFILFFLNTGSLLIKTILFRWSFFYFILRK